MVSTALVHYIAHFRGQNDEARLQGLLAGCQKFLFQVTIAGSILAALLAKPLGRFFHFRTSLMLTALVCVLVSLWSGFAVALCQGMAWFKRLAIIGLVGVGMRLLFGWVMTKRFPNGGNRRLRHHIFAFCQPRIALLVERHLPARCRAHFSMESAFCPFLARDRSLCGG